MARNKRKRAEERWQRKRERMGPPGMEDPRLRPKRSRRYNYSDQLKVIQAGCIEETRERLAADRGELIVTLNLCGAEFFTGHVSAHKPFYRVSLDEGEGWDE